MTDRNTSTAGSRSVLSRFIMGCAAVIFTAYAFLVIRNQVVYGFEFIGATMGAGVTFLGGFCWLFAFDGRGRQNSRRFHLALLSGCVVGTFGFIGGFLGPMLFSPKSNTGPLIGIFVTGPLGFVVGSIGGLLYSSVEAKFKGWPKK